MNNHRTRLRKLGRVARVALGIVAAAAMLAGASTARAAEKMVFVAGENLHILDDLNGTLEVQTLSEAMSLGAAAFSQASASQLLFQNVVEITDIRALDHIEGSINQNAGIAGVNQSAGNMANQVNAVAIALIGSGALAEGEGNLAWSQATASQVSIGNQVEQAGASFQTKIQDSINENTGIVGVNQSPGNANNQANVVALSGTAAVTDPAGAAATDLLANQVLLGNQVNAADTSAVISGSANANFGIVGINQSPGSLNNQANVVSLADATSAPLQGSVANLASANSFNTSDMGGSRENRIESSFGGSGGIVSVNQSAGNLNNQSNLISMTLGLQVGSEASVVGDSDLKAISLENGMVEEKTPQNHSDVLASSFGGFLGIGQVSQTSGDMNSVSNHLSVSVTRMNLQ